MRLPIALIALLLPLSFCIEDGRAQAVDVTGVHTSLQCSACHAGASAGRVKPDEKARTCTGCHDGYEAMFDHAMSHRQAEKAFVQRTWGRSDPRFFEKNCQGCHVSSCGDCHGEDAHRTVRPGTETCLACHRGYFAGSGYLGRAPREDNLRYQRGPEAGGEHFLKMLPDLHSEVGLACSDCHTMASFLKGATAAKTCAGCHQPDDRVIEHAIAAHMEKLECYACHSAWSAQEYGTFFLRMVDSPQAQYFRLKKAGGEDYLKSAYLKAQNAPPLGVNERGRVSPIRPQFISYFSHVREGMAVGEENRLLAAEWKALFPHTVQRGTVMCDECHNNPRRFVLEPPEERIYLLRQDGMSLESFWDRKGQKVTNGDFLEPWKVRRLSEKTPTFKKRYVEKWKRLVDRVEDSSPD